MSLVGENFWGCSWVEMRIAVVGTCGAQFALHPTGIDELALILHDVVQLIDYNIMW